jgi:acyl carrier protein
MMNYQEITQIVSRFLIEDFEVSPENITPEATLRDTLDLDSLDYIDLIVAIDNHFSIKMKPEDFQDLHTIKDFYDFIYAGMDQKITA